MVQFIASHIPLNLSIVQKTTGGCFKDRADLIAYIDGKASTVTSPYLVVKCQCGKQYTYSSKDQVPASNVVCDCGRNVIIYGK